MTFCSVSEMLRTAKIADVINGNIVTIVSTLRVTTLPELRGCSQLFSFIFNYNANCC